MKETFVSTIVSDGKWTNARTVDDHSYGKGTARCADGDAYSREIGAVIALCRSMNVKVEDTCWAVLDAMKRREAYYAEKNAAKVSKVKVKEASFRGMQAGKIRDGKVVLRRFGVNVRKERMGVCGDETKFVDKDGKPLRVGDLVTVDMLVGQVRTGRKWEAAPGLHFVCVDEDGPYVFGLCSGCNPKTGKIDGKFRIRLVKTWREVEVGEVHDGVRVEVVGDGANE